MSYHGADRIKENSSTAGTNSFVLTGPVTGEGVRAFGAAEDGKVIRYAAKHITAAEAEVGYGVYTHATRTLTRQFRFYPTRGGPAVNFSPNGLQIASTPITADFLPNHANADPTANDDISAGFLPGMDWINDTTEAVFKCVKSPAGAAVWVQISGGGSGGHTIQEDGTPLTSRAGLNFGDGLLAADDAGNNRTNVSLQIHSQAEAEGGSATGKAMDALRVAQAIAAQQTQGALPLADHLSPASGNLGSGDFRKFIVADQNLTVPNSWSAEEWAWIFNEGTGNISLSVTGGTINGVSSVQIVPGGMYFFWCRANAGTAPQLIGGGDSTETQVVNATIFFNGQVAHGNKLRQGTRSNSGTALDAAGAYADSGGDFLTGGVNTIPNLEGWHCDLEIGANTHDLIFNGNTLDISVEGFLPGEIYSVRVRAGNAVRVVGPAGQFTESDFT